MWICGICRTIKEARDCPRDIRHLEVLGLFTQGSLTSPTGTANSIPEVSTEVSAKGR